MIQQKGINLNMQNNLFFPFNFENDMFLWDSPIFMTVHKQTCAMVCGFSVWERWIGIPQCSAEGDWRIGGLSRSLSLRRDSCLLMLAVTLPLEVALCPVRLWCSGLSRAQLFPRNSSRGLKCPVTVTVTGGELRSSPLPWQWPSLRRPGTRRRRASVRFRCLKRGKRKW